MSNLCRFTGHNLSQNCPLDDDCNYNNVNERGGPIDFEKNSYWNPNSNSNIKSGFSGGIDDRLRRINGPLRVNGDVYIEGDIIGNQGAVFNDEIKTNVTGITVSCLQTENQLLRDRVDKLDRIMEYFSVRFSVNFDDIDKEVKKLANRNNVDKRLDAIE